AAQTRYTSTNEQPLTILSNDEYNAIRVKGLTNSVQYAMGVQYSFPDVTFSFYGSPSAENQFRIRSGIHFASFWNL
ncbi:hypothetical protein, partial [Pseudomonas syringae]|uniref:hypothetical protein n=1 Tax=Pseudomonas syringae TaxID=317 RepID=UPI0034D45AD7